MQSIPYQTPLQAFRVISLEANLPVFFVFSGVFNRLFRETGIEVVAVHNHMVHEQPRIFFLHYWGVGKAAGLAGTLRKALDLAPGRTTEKMKM